MTINLKELTALLNSDRRTLALLLTSLLAIRDLNIVYLEEGIEETYLDTRSWNHELFNCAPEIFGKYWPKGKKDKEE